jgi:viroplasmin and RNaseH domain-containing protein
MAPGRVLGVYTSWAEAKLQVDGFKTALHKIFKSRSAAERYVR